MNTLFCVWRTAMGKQSSHSMLRLHRMPWAQVSTSTCVHITMLTMLHQMCTCTKRDSHFLSNMFHEGTPIGRYYSICTFDALYVHCQWSSVYVVYAHSMHCICTFDALYMHLYVSMHYICMVCITLTCACNLTTM